MRDLRDAPLDPGHCGADAAPKRSAPEDVPRWKVQEEDGGETKQGRMGAVRRGGIAGGSGQGDELSLHVANVARVFVQMSELQLFEHVGGLQPGKGGDCLAGARSLGSALGRSLHALAKGV